MKEHIGRIILLLFSIAAIIFFVRSEYKEEEVEKTEGNPFRFPPPPAL